MPQASSTVEKKLRRQVSAIERGSMSERGNEGGELGKRDGNRETQTGRLQAGVPYLVDQVLELGVLAQVGEVGVVADLLEVLKPG